MGIASVENVSKTYYFGESPVNVLNSISFEIEPNELLCLIGPKGCGKTTMLNILAGLEHPTSGEVVVHGQREVAFGDFPRNIRRRVYDFRDHGNIDGVLLLRGLPRDKFIPANAAGVEPRCLHGRVAAGLHRRRRTRPSTRR